MPRAYWNPLPAVSATSMAVRKNVRINTISQSPTLTTAGSGVKGMDHLMDFAKK